MKKVLGVVGLVLVLTLAGCRTREIRQREYYEPTDQFKIEFEYTNEEGIVIKDIKGPLKKETIIHEDGANEFSPGKEFNLKFSGFSM